MRKQAPIPRRGVSLRRTACLSMLCLLATLAACRNRAPASEPPNPVAATPLCDVGRNNDNGVIGHDGGYSVLLPDGTRFWAFGDTWIGGIVDGKREIRSGLHSTGALQRNADLCSPVEYLTDEGGAVRQLIPDPKEAAIEGTENWVLASFVAGDRVYAYYQRVRKNDRPVQEINFDVLGIGVASADIGTLIFEPASDGALLFTEDDHGFADALFYDSEFLYGFGCAVQPGRLERPCRLARVPLAGIADRDAYRYWDGTGWQEDLARAVVVIESGSSEMTLTECGGRFLLVYSPPFSCDVVLRAAPRLEGPWSPPLRLFSGEVDAANDAFCYGAKLQRVSPDCERLTITWNSNGPLVLHANDPHLYWPHAVEVRVDDLPGLAPGDDERRAR